MIEGVSFALAEGIEVLHETGVVADNIALIGGGAKVCTGDNYLPILAVKPLNTAPVVMSVRH